MNKKELVRRCWWILLVGVGVGLVVGCQSGAEPAPEAPPSTAAARSQGGGNEKPGAPAGEPSAEQKLIRSAELELEVDSYAAARRGVDALLKRLGGFVANSSVAHGDRSASTATLELRVPNQKLDRAIHECSQLGTVLRENVSARDVTEEHRDSRARVSNARKLEARLLELAATDTSDVKEVLEVERELGRVRETIEVLDAELAGLDSRVALSQLTLELRTRDRYASGPPESLGDQMSRTFSGSVASLLTFGRGLLLLATALAPWLPLAVLAAGLGWVLVRVSNRRRHA